MKDIHQNIAQHLIAGIPYNSELYVKRGDIDKKLWQRTEIDVNNIHAPIVENIRDRA